MSRVIVDADRPGQGSGWRVFGSIRPRGARMRLPAALVVLALAMAGALSTAPAAMSSPAGPASPAWLVSSTSVTGTVIAAGKPLDGAKVTLYAGSSKGVRRLGHARTGTSGRFSIMYTAPASGILYVAADGGAASGSLRLMAVVGVLAGGGVAPRTLSTVTVNELTTVAATYALARFINGPDISGPGPGLENAAATASNLADAASGTLGGVVTDANNGARNATLATLNTLADLVAVCSARPAGGRCGELLHLATPPGETTPADTVQAVLNLVKNPALSLAGLYALAKTQTVYQPALAAPPAQWMLALLYTDTGLYASGRIAIDAKGDIWSNNNWQPGTTNPSTVVTVLNPVGSPILGSPISGGGIEAGGWGTAIAADGAVWLSNFGGSTMSELAPDGIPLSPGAGWPNGGLNHPQGVAVDQKGNVWIANNFGPESAPGQGDVVVYPGGDPAKAITITGGGLNHPFAIQIDGQGRAWVDNAGLSGAKLVDTRAAILSGKAGGSVTVIGPDFKPTAFSPIQSKSFKWPLGLALDSNGNAWTVSFFSNRVTEIYPDGTVAASFKLPGPVLPFSEAIDGSGRVWVADFGVPGVMLLCGASTAACPPGSSTGEVLSPRLGFRSATIQHLTSVQIDQSGNLWLSNNWSKLVPPTGGTGVVELIGMATPVCTPLLGLPVTPRAGTGGACPGG
jgi:hypothetical protein